MLNLSIVALEGISWNTVHMELKALLLFKLHYSCRPLEGDTHHSIACDSLPVQQIEQVSPSQCCDRTEMLSQYVRSGKQNIMKWKGLKHKNKQSRSRWGKQTAISEGVLCSKRGPEAGSPTVAHCCGGRESHTSAWLAWRKKHTVKVHVQGHNDKGCGLVHCAQRTMLATTDSLFAEWLQVSSVENVHLTEHMRKLNVTLSLFILWGNTAVETQRNVPAIGHHIGYDEGVMIYSTCGFSLRLYENTLAERQDRMLCLQWWSTSVSCSQF